MNESYLIVDTDNFGGDYPDEKFLCIQDEKGTTYLKMFHCREDAELVANALNAPARQNPTYPRFYKVVKHPYTLQGAFEP